MNKTAKTAARKTVNVLMLVILAFLTTLPIFWCIITSLKTPQDISAYPPKIFNFTVTWNNYKQVFAQSFLETALSIRCSPFWPALSWAISRPTASNAAVSR